MHALEVRTIIEALMPPLLGVVTRAAAPLLARIEALEAREAVAGPPGPSGPPGRDVDLAQVRLFVAEAVAALPPAEAGPPGKDGAAGQDGENADPEIVLGMVATQLEEMVVAAVEEVVAAIPPAEAGKDGAPGRDGRDGMPGPAGRDGIDGKDGLAGAAGRDGLSAEDMTVSTPDEGRTFIFTLQRGGEVISQNVVTTGLPVDRGVWKEGSYGKGDGVTLGGEYWIARRDTKLKPLYGPNSDWRLAVKKGRDGRDGHDGKPGEPGPEGRPGRDLTQLGPDGKKW